MMNPRGHQQSSRAEAALQSTICLLLIDSIGYSLIVLWLVSHPYIPQSTHSSHSLSTWWSFPTWPFTWQPSGTLGTKRWSLQHHRKTSGTECELWVLEWHHDAMRLRSATVSEVILEQQVRWVFHKNNSHERHFCFIHCCWWKIFKGFFFFISDIFHYFFLVLWISTICDSSYIIWLSRQNFTNVILIFAE